MLTLPLPRFISVREELSIISVLFILDKLSFICFKTEILLNASFISLNISFLSQCSSDRLSTHFGKEIFICSIGNSYNNLPNMSLISSIDKLEQSVGSTDTPYFSSSFLASSRVYEEEGSSLFNTITKGLFKA